MHDREVILSWTGSDTVANDHDKSWYTKAILVFIGITALLILLFVIKVLDLTTILTAIVLMTLIYVTIFMSFKQPSRQANYELTANSIIIDGVEQPFSKFRAFGVRKLGGLWQLVLIPSARFGMELEIYIDERQGEQIVDVIAQHLPMEDVAENKFEAFLRKFKI